METCSTFAAAQEVRRVRLTHHVLTLDDGHRVGVSVGGAGVPLVFLHGLGLSRRAYLRLLSRVAGQGFKVVAIDAPGHGDTHDLPRRGRQFADRVNLTLRALDALGVTRAVFAGHSMGGRTVIQLAAEAPERVLAAVVFDAAAGATFDEDIPNALRSPWRAAKTIGGALYDTRKDPVRLELAERIDYLRMIGAVGLKNLLRPGGPTGATLALVNAGDSRPFLRVIREHQIPFFVMHGEKDIIIPLQSAREMAEEADGTLYCVPGAYHSWVIANPRQGADSFRQLLAGELGTVLRNLARSLGIRDPGDTAAWEHALIEPDALLRSLDDGLDEVGTEPPESVQLDVLRTSTRPQQIKREPWHRRAYRRLSDRREVRRVRTDAEYTG
ncbi:alpha/beta hydrolase [Mycobacterium sp. MYCO198283]|uniref:alpha/beta fold hydrolase n=1 Tax=Mycobacterium sp. MYCO198283 TaxID=2883505 RepID=UPI001E3F3324|nr:alpha/beta hydrolase [Mycobacterium sp. MYCO198283]MCG5430894.1 alpha/beta hydrolase [Mycobacterium sp. MYCO198283]